jgi:predicted deacylase
MSLTIGGRGLEPGERRECFAELGHRPDGTPLGVPLVGIRGQAPGPVLGVIAGVHGDEFEGPEAARIVLNEISPQRLKGGILCTPQANITAYEAVNRTSWIDHLDLNRSFPGRQDGFVTQRVAEILIDQIVEHADFVLDLHSAGLAYDLMPYVGFHASRDSSGEASYGLAKAFGIDILYASTPFPNVLRLEAASRSKPAILVEVGGEGRCRPDRVAIMARGLRNILCHLGMLDGSPEGLPDHYTITQAPPAGEFVHVSTGGFMRNCCQLGARVQKGETLGIIVDPFGAELGRVEAPLDGIVLISRTIPLVRTGEWGYAVVKVVEEVTNSTPLTKILGAII